MDAVLTWRGDAVAVAQVVLITPGEVVSGRDYTLRINSKDITCQGATALALVDAFVEAINASSIPEWREVVATSTADDVAEYGTFDGTVGLVLTSREAGVPFTVTGLVAGFEQRAAIVITMWHTPTGGTWNFDAGAVETGGYGEVDFAYDDTVSEIQTEMDTMFGAGNTLVSRRNYADPARVVTTIEFIGSLAGKAVIPVTVDGSGLTGGDAALVVTGIQAAVAGTDEVQTVTCFGSPTGGTRGFRFRGQTATVAYNASPATVQTAMRALSTIAGANVTVTGTANSSYVFTFGGALAHQALDAIQVISSGLTGGTVYAEVTVTTPGAAGENQINYVMHREYAQTQAQIQLDETGTWSGGSWTLKIAGDTTAAIAWNATNADIVDAIETLLGTQGVIVRDLVGGYKQILFYGPLYSAFLGTVSVFSAITGGTVTLSSYASGSGGTGSSPADQAYHFEINPGTGVVSTGSIARNASMATIQAAIQAVTGPGTATVTALEGGGNLYAAGDGLYQIEWKAALGGGYVNVTVIQEGGDVIGLVETEIYRPGASTGTNEVQAVTVHGSPTYGTFTLANGTDETDAVAYNDTAVSVLNKLLALSSFGPGDLSASGGPLSAASVSLTYGGTYSYSDVPTLVVNDDDLKARVVRTTPGVTGKNEVQRLSLLGQNVRAGTLTLTVAGDAVDPLAYNADIVTIIAALEASTGLTAGDLSESYGGPWPEQDVFIVFGGSVAETNVALTTATDDLTNAYISTVAYDPLIVRTVTEATGPHHFNEPVNWYHSVDPSIVRAPERGDTLLFTEGNVDVLYGGVLMLTYTADASNDLIVVDKDHDLREGQAVEVWSIGGTPPAGLAANTAYYVVQLDPVTGNFALATTATGDPIDISGAGTGTHWIGVRLRKFVQWSGYTGRMGLPWRNADYKEYRPLDLEFGLLPAGPKLVTIGQGEGNGSGRVSLFTGPDQIILDCVNSAGSADRTRPAVVWRGENALTAVKLLGGDLGIAVRPTESAVFTTLEQRGGTIACGADVEADTWDKTGGAIGVMESINFGGAIAIRG